MKIQVFNMVSESFRYGESQGIKVWRFASKEQRDSAYEKELQAMRNIEDLTEYEPENFSDSNNKWAYSYEKKEEIIEINEKEEGELLSYIIVQSRKDKIKKLRK